MKKLLFLVFVALLSIILISCEINNREIKSDYINSNTLNNLNFKYDPQTSYETNFIGKENKQLDYSSEQKTELTGFVDIFLKSVYRKNYTFTNTKDIEKATTLIDPELVKTIENDQNYINLINDILLYKADLDISDYKIYFDDISEFSNNQNQKYIRVKITIDWTLFSSDNTEFNIKHPAIYGGDNFYDLVLYLNENNGNCINSWIEYSRDTKQTVLYDKVKIQELSKAQKLDESNEKPF